jgi:hypothetical protein
MFRFVSSASVLAHVAHTVDATSSHDLLHEVRGVALDRATDAKQSVLNFLKKLLPSSEKKCVAADIAIWNAHGKKDFKKYMTGCGKSCWGEHACVSKCVVAKEKFAKPCADCFGDLAQCTRDHCWYPCMDGDCPSCSECTKKSCVPSFAKCSGFEAKDVPSSIFMATASCSDDDMEIWNDHGKSEFKTFMTDCGKQCMGAKSCVSSCVLGKEKFSQSCSDCFGDLGQCTRDHCMLACMNGDSPSCETCTQKYCVGDFSTCSGIQDVPKESVVEDVVLHI